MDIRKTVLLGIKRGLFLALLAGFAFWPELTGGRTSRMPVTEAGRGFRRATEQPPWSRDVNAVAIDEDGEVFVAVGGACGSDSGAGVFRSTDAGVAWTQQNKGLTNTSVRSLAVAATGAIFAGTHDGVFRSSDSGNTWSPTTLRGVDISTLVSGPGVLFAGDGCLCSGVYRSRDNGNSWEKVNAGLATCVKSLAIAGDAVFAATATDGVYRSGNNGDSWAPANTGLTALALKSVAVNDEGDVFLGSAADGVFRSEDSGQTWARVGLKGVGVNTLAIGTDNEMYAGTDTAVYRSTDEGDKWQPVDLDFAERAEVSVLAFDPSGIAFAAAGRNILRTVSARITSESGARPNATTVVSAPVVDSTSSGSGKAVASLSWSHTVSATANQVLIVGTSNVLAPDSSKTITGVTYGGAPLTRAGFVANGNNVRAEIWYLLAPPAGTANVVVTLPAATDITGGSIGVAGVDPGTGLGTFASATGGNNTPAVVATAIAGSSLVIDTLATQGSAGTTTASVGQTARWNLATGATDQNIRGTGSTETAATASVTMAWTLQMGKQWALGAISLNGVGACCAACVLGYPAPEAGFPRSNTIFLESPILKGVQGPPQCEAGVQSNVIAWYSDEHAITLGVRQVDLVSGHVCSGGTSPGSPCTSNAQCGKNGTCVASTTTTSYPVSAMTTNPSRASAAVPLPSGAVTLATGTNALSGDQAGTDTNTCGDPLGCGRPMWPALFVTDITNDPTSRAGDWQHYGIANNPSDVFGTWKTAVRTVDNTVSPPAVSVVPDADPAKNNWVLGPGADTVPAGLINEGYGAEVRWKLTSLIDNNGQQLVANRKYRLQVIVHDGDQNKSGGDVGQGCAVATFDQTCFTPDTPTPTPTNLTPPPTPTPTPTNTPTNTPTVTPSGGADLVAVKTGVPTSICINGVTGDVNVSCSSPETNCSGTPTNLTYSINVTNNGPNTATAVTLTDPLPTVTDLATLTTFVSCRIAPDIVCPNPGVAVGANGTVTVSLGNMTPFNNQIVRIVVAVNGDGILTYNDTHPVNQQITQISNTATVTSSNDPNPANNSPQISTSVNYCNPPGLQFRPNKS